MNSKFDKNIYISIKHYCLGWPNIVIRAPTYPGIPQHKQCLILRSQPLLSRAPHPEVKYTSFPLGGFDFNTVNTDEYISWCIARDGFKFTQNDDFTQFWDDHYSPLLSASTCVQSEALEHLLVQQSAVEDLRKLSQLIIIWPLKTAQIIIVDHHMIIIKPAHAYSWKKVVCTKILIMSLHIFLI